MTTYTKSRCSKCSDDICRGVAGKTIAAEIA